MNESINQQVWHAIQTDPAVQQNLTKKLINIRSLAKYLIKRNQLRTSLDAVISSIRRYQNNNDNSKQEEILKPIFKNSIISTKNNIVCITVEGRPRDIIDKLKGTTTLSSIRMTTGSQAVKILVEHHDQQQIQQLFKTSIVEKNLSEMTVRVSKESITTKGVLSRMAAELAIANINIHEMLVCPPEFLIYVSSTDIVKAHERILSLME